MAGAPAITFVDRVSVWSILAIALLARHSDLWHYEPLSPGAHRLLRVAQLLGLVRGRVRQVDASIGDLKDENGSSLLLSLLWDARRLSARIGREWIMREPVVHALGPEWPATTLAFHLDKLFEVSVRTERLRIAVCCWITQRDARTLDDALLLIARRPWIGFISDVAREHGLRVAVYPDLGGHGRSIVRILARLVPRLSAITGFRRPRTRAVEAGPLVAGAIAVGTRYGHRSVSLDMDRHTELFWLADAPPTPVVLYDYEGTLPSQVTAELLARGVMVEGRVPQLSWPALRTAMPLWSRIWAAVIKAMVRERRVPFGIARALSSLALDFASWRTFFASRGILLNVVGSNGSSGQVLALDSLGGISVNYQYSISNIVAPTTGMTAGESVQLVYAPIFADLMRALDPPTERFITTGALSDGAEPAAALLRRRTRVLSTRARLTDAGARFVICFFDENSADRWDMLQSSAGAARDYEILLSWLAEDPTLGLVFKPKKPWDLRERLGRIAAQLDRLVSAGRCVIVGETDSARETHVAEAALAADLCIGKLSAGTAALEAFLVGIPSIMVDVDALHDHPLRGRDGGRVIFDGWEDVRIAVESHRREPGSHPGLGDWSPFIDQIDPYRDGRAVERMRSHIARMLDGLRSGSPPSAIVRQIGLDEPPAQSATALRTSVGSATSAPLGTEMLPGERSAAGRVAGDPLAHEGVDVLGRESETRSDRP